MKLLNNKYLKVFFIVIVFYLLLFLLAYILLFFLKKTGIYFFVNNHLIILLIFNLLFFIIGKYYFNNNSNKEIKTIYIILIFIFVQFTPILAFNSNNDFGHLFLSSIDSLAYFISLSIGLISRRFKKNKLFATYIIFICVCLISYFYIFPLKFQYDNYKNYTGRINLNLKEIILLHNKNDTINLKNEKKIMVIEFWNNSCSQCIREFPKYKKLIKKNIDKKNVKFIYVNVYKDNAEKEKSLEILKKINSEKIDNYFIHKDEVKNFKIVGFPKLVVVKNNTIIFDGYIETLSIFGNSYFN